MHHAIGIKNAPVFTSKTDDFHKKKLKYGAPLTPSPAACDTLSAFFRDTDSSPSDFDRIVTGDLGMLGSEILRDLLRQEGLDLGARYTDCGLLLYDREGQDMHSGGSGCGCCAAVLCAHLLPEMERGTIQRLLFAPTGALLSPTSSFQGESIPGICHALCLEVRKDGQE